MNTFKIKYFKSANYQYSPEIVHFEKNDLLESCYNILYL